MCKGFYLTAIGMQSRLDDGFTIARGHGAGNVSICRHRLIECLYLLDYRSQRRTLITAIGCIEYFLVPADGRYLRGSGTGIYAHVQGALIGAKLTTLNPVLVMPFLKFPIFCLIGKKRKVRFTRFAGCS